jgi:glycosyltransferase involved in cell wall biosynthesis
MKADSPFSAVVLTFNERVHVERCLRSLLPVAREVLVVDSASTDGTADLARSLGARVIQRAFKTHADQWHFALAQGLQGAWTIALDADQYLTSQLTASLLAMARSVPEDVQGLFVNRLHVFRGRPLRHGGLFPKWMLKVFRTGAAFTDDAELLDHHFYVRGRTARAEGLLIEENLKERDISFWCAKHIKYAERQAVEELRRRRGGAGWAKPPRLFGAPDERILWLKARWYRLPLYTRPFLYVAWRYFLRLGFLDGKQGLVFHALQAFWFRLLVDIKIEELATFGDRPDGQP